MHFLDQAKIFIRSGAGGAGAVAFRREKYVEYGGPDGGNGGKGGDIIFEAVPGLNTLIDFRYTQHFKAQRGGGGSGANRFGAGGDDLVIKVPVGTQVLDDDRETVLLDLTVAPVRGEGGAVAWLLAEGRDLPGELEQTGERYRAFMTATSDVIYQMSPDWTEMRHLLGRDFRAVPGWRSMSIPTIMRGCRGRSRKLSGTRRFLNWNIG